MLKGLLKLTSLKNLSSDNGGQIATIMILVMVALLIIILITVNLGQVAMQATAVSNACDNSALALGSQLSSKVCSIAESLYAQCKNWFKCCVKGGALAWVLAIIAAILVVVTWGWAYPLLIIAVAAIAGAIGGAIIGGTWGYAFKGAQAGIAVGASIATGGWLGTLALAATVYNYSVSEKDIASALDAFAKSLNGLPEYERLREGVFLNALSQTVDEPRTIKESECGVDLNSDGEISGIRMPYFYCWWDQVHMPAVRAALGDDTTGVTGTYKDNLNTFRSDLLTFVSELDRYEVECPCQTPALSEGTMIKLWRDLKYCQYDIDFWAPGPLQADLLNWQGCTTCVNAEEQLVGYDEVDASRMVMEEFISATRTLISKSATTLDLTYNDWIGTLIKDGQANWSAETDYCGPLGTGETEDDGLVQTLRDIADAMGDWKDATRHIRDHEAPRCTFSYGNNTSTDVVSIMDSPLDCSPPESTPGSVMPCTWKAQEITGDSAYYSNYPCVVRDTDRPSLLQQVANVRLAFETSVMDQIKEDHPPSRKVKKGTVPEYAVTFTLLQLQGVPAVKCSGAGIMNYGEGESAILTYGGYGSVTYEYEEEVEVEVCEDLNGDGDTNDTICTDNNGDGDTSDDGECVSECRTETRTESGTTTEAFTIDPPATIEIADAGNITIFQDCVADPASATGQTCTMRAAGSSDEFFAALDAIEAKINAEYVDKFQYVIDKLDAMIPELYGFYNTTIAYVHFMQNAKRTLASDGQGSVSYSWNDSRCFGSEQCHTVSVWTGPFKTAKTQNTKTGNWLKYKKCTNLRCYKDGDNAWVRVRREDGTNVPVQSKKKSNFFLGLWNPSGSGYSGVIDRTTWIGYGMDTGSHPWDPFYLKIKKVKNE